MRFHCHFQESLHNSDQLVESLTWIRSTTAVEPDTVVVVFAEFVKYLVLALLAPLQAQNHTEAGLEPVAA